ncbi:MAG: glycerophosphodiester phosphodiesterase family protein, partial [Candidatus Omnitrophota bacterium]
MREGIRYWNVKKNEKADVLKDSFDLGKFDVITLSKALHHLIREEDTYEPRPLSTRRLLYVRKNRTQGPYAGLYRITETQQRVIDRLLDSLEDGGILFLNLSYAYYTKGLDDESFQKARRESLVDKSNSDTFIMIQRRDAGSFWIYDEVMPFRSELDWLSSLKMVFMKRKTLAEWFFNGKKKDRPGETVFTRLGILMKKDPNVKNEVESIFHEADFLAYRHERINRSVWGQIFQAVEVRDQKKSLTDILSKYLEYVPNKHPVKKELIVRAQKLDHRIGTIEGISGPVSNEIRSEMRRPIIAAHRGGSPNNHTSQVISLEAIKQSVAMGVDAVEFDLQMTKDGKIVSHHAQYMGLNFLGWRTKQPMIVKTVKSVQDAINGFLSKLYKLLDWDWLKSIEVRLLDRMEDISFEDAEKVERGLPTIEQIYDAMKESSARFNIHIVWTEGKNQALIDKLAEFIKAKGIIDRSIVFSFYSGDLLKIKKALPDVERCRVFFAHELKEAISKKASDPMMLVNMANEAHAQYITWPRSDTYPAPDWYLIGRLKKAGLKIDLGTKTNPTEAEVRAYVKSGADILTVIDPKSFLESEKKLGWRLTFPEKDMKFDGDLPLVVETFAPGDMHIKLAVTDEAFKPNGESRGFFDRPINTYFVDGEPRGFGVVDEDMTTPREDFGARYEKTNPGRDTFVLTGSNLGWNSFHI